jgi:fatty acyl-CoA reductase
MHSCVMLTGGTGLVGMAMVEKLLRCCPDIGTIYLLTRDDNRKGTPAADRIKKLLEDECFELAKRENLGCENKVKAVRGDIAVDQLGISTEDRAELVEHVTASKTAHDPRNYPRACIASGQRVPCTLARTQ